MTWYSDTPRASPLTVQDVNNQFKEHCEYLETVDESPKKRAIADAVLRIILADDGVRKLCSNILHFFAPVRPETRDAWTDTDCDKEDDAFCKRSSCMS